MDKIAFQTLIEKKLEQESSNSYQPEIDDLFFLYSLVKDKVVTSILEYGSGWSTYALALALNENSINFGEGFKIRKMLQRSNGSRKLARKRRSTRRRRSSRRA